MDYSLLLVIEYNANNEDNTIQKRGSIRVKNTISVDLDKSSQERQQTYHMGIIDYLQEYNLEKRLENCAKATFIAKTKE